jgi:hypothetical protein
MFTPTEICAGAPEAPLIKTRDNEPRVKFFHIDIIIASTH